MKAEFLLKIVSNFGIYLTYSARFSTYFFQGSKFNQILAFIHVPHFKTATQCPGLNLAGSQGRVFYKVTPNST